MEPHTCEKEAVWKSKEQALKDKIVQEAIVWSNSDTPDEELDLCEAVDALEEHRKTKP